MLRLGSAAGKLQGKAMLLGQYHAAPYSLSPASCAPNVRKRWPECIKYSPEASPPGLVLSKKKKKKTVHGIGDHSGES